MIFEYQKHSIPMNRSIVVTPQGTCLCRPSKTGPDLPSCPRQCAFRKEHGDPIIDAEGRRVVR
jgi:arsenate reductase